MLKENCIKILGAGLSCIKTAYKNVILDIDQSEKEQKADSYTFSAEGFIPNSAEKYNLSLRSQYQVQSIAPSELTHLIRTRKFSFSYANQILKAAEMLIKVLDLAKDINSKLAEIVKAEKRIKRDAKIPAEDKDFQIAKTAVNNYIEILLEIKTRISDLNTSECNHCILRAYTGLDTRVRSMLETSFIPDELAEDFNRLYENYPLHKFSTAKQDGISKTTTLMKFKELSTRLYSAALKPFLTELMEIYYYFVTPEAFLNNPVGKTLFVIPMSFYKKFNFAKSGLTREEVVFIDSSRSMKKNTKALAEFYDELYASMNCMYDKITEQKHELFSSKDKYEIEAVIKKYEEYFCTKTEGNLKSVQEMLKNAFFREKFTLLVYELRPDLVVDILTINQNPWEITRDITEDDELDRETTVYLHHLLQLCFGNKKFPSQRIQLIRLLHIFSYNDKPEKSYSRYVSCIQKGTLSWANSEIGKTFRAALER